MGGCCRAEEWCQRTDSTQDSRGSTDCVAIILKGETFILKSPGNRLDLISSELKLTKQAPTRNKRRLMNEKQSRMEFNDKSRVKMDKDKTVGSLLMALTQCLSRAVISVAAALGLSQSVWKTIKHECSLMSSASGSSLPQESLSVAV